MGLSGMSTHRHEAGGSGSQGPWRILHREMVAGAGEPSQVVSGFGAWPTQRWGLFQEVREEGVG